MLSCVWSETSLDPDNRSHYAIATLVNNTLDRAELGFVHRNGFKQLPPDADGAVVIIHGEHEAPNAVQTLANVARLGWAVVIIIGDDAALFPSELLRGPRRKIWVQMPIPGVHDFADRRLTCSYPHDAPGFLELCQKEIREKPLHWMFSGQVNNSARRECVAQLRMINHGFLMQTPGFWQGLDRLDYYKKLASCKIAPCPTGAATPDTIRWAEALEAGCVPIAEDRFPPGFPRRCYRPGLTGYWRYVLGEEPPFPTLSDWRDYPALHDQALREWPTNQQRLQTWWQAYKEKLRSWLVEDVNVVRR